MLYNVNARYGRSVHSQAAEKPQAEFLKNFSKKIRAFVLNTLYLPKISGGGHTKPPAGRYTDT